MKRGGVDLYENFIDLSENMKAWKVVYPVLKGIVEQSYLPNSHRKVNDQSIKKPAPC